jgi:hypothetical protein
MPDNTSSIIPIGGGSGGSATNITIGTTTVTGGGTNRVLYEDSAQKVAASASFTFDGTTIESSLQTNISGPDATTNVEIGSTANDANAGTGGTSVVIGNAATAGQNPAGIVLVGSAATNITSAGTDSVGIGRAASVAGANAISIGAAATSAASGIAIGSATSAVSGQSVAIGVSSAATVNTFVSGSANHVMSNVYFGKGITSTAASAYSINGTGGSGADNAGADLILASGASTGAGAPANVKIQSTLVAGSSSTAQALVDTAIYKSGWQQLQRGEVALNGNYTNATASFTSTALSVTVVNARTYKFTCCLFFADSTAADGAQFDFNGGTATATNFIAQAVATNNAGAILAVTNAASTTLATAIQVALALTSQTLIVIQGSFVPSAAGTFIVRAAQTAHSTGTLTVNRGSFLSMADVVAV